MNTSHTNINEVNTLRTPHTTTNKIIGSDSQRPLRGWTLTAVIIALFMSLLMAALDGTIVDTATPRIIGDLYGFSLYSWLITIYLLTSTTTIPIVGKLSDMLGRKWFIKGCPYSCWPAA